MPFLTPAWCERVNQEAASLPEVEGATGTLAVSISRPTDPGTGWIATGRESSGGNAGNWAVQTWVVCVTVAP